MSGEAEPNLHFSNETLSNYLSFLQTSEESQKYQELVDTLDIDPSWLENRTFWHTAEFHDEFISTFKKIYGDNREVLKKVVRQPLVKKAPGFFYFFNGFIRPPKSTLFTLIEKTKKKNLYNSYEFKTSWKKFSMTGGTFIQRYKNPAWKSLNNHLCDDFKENLSTTMKLSGHQLVELSEENCVKRGDQYCSYKVIWINGSFWSKIFAWAVLSGTLYAASIALELFSVPLSIALATATSAALVACYSLTRNKLKYDDALSYQQESNEELKEAAEEAVTLAALGEISFGVIHDMASPIQLLNFYSSTLSDKLHEQELHREKLITYSDAIDSGVNRLNKLVNIFRLSTRKGGSDTPKQLDLKKIVTSCVDLFSLYIESKKITVTVETPEAPVEIFSIESYVESILLNLVQNAINALSTTAEPKLRLAVYEEDSRVILEIKDNGPGIPEDRVRHLWKRFGPSHSKKGTGFGLYNIKNMVTQISGEITVATSKAGTTFRIFMPLKIDYSPGVSRSADV